MNELRFGAAVILMLMAGFVVVMNWGYVIANEWNKRKGIDRYYSTVPLVSFFLAGILAYQLYPFSPKAWIALIPALDIGNWILLIGLPTAIARGALKRKDTPPNRR